MLGEALQRKFFFADETYSTNFWGIVKQLLKEGKITQYSAYTEYVSGLLEEVQDDLQHNLNIQWTKVYTLNMETIITEVIALEDQRDERACMIGTTISYTTDSTIVPSTSSPPPTNACVTISDPLPKNKLMLLIDKMIELNSMVDVIACAIRTAHLHEEYRNDKDEGHFWVL